MKQTVGYIVIFVIALLVGFGLGLLLMEAADVEPGLETTVETTVEKTVEVTVPAPPGSGETLPDTSGYR